MAAGVQVVQLSFRLMRGGGSRTAAHLSRCSSSSHHHEAWTPQCGTLAGRAFALAASDPMGGARLGTSPRCIWELIAVVKPR